MQTIEAYLDICITIMVNHNPLNRPLEVVVTPYPRLTYFASKISQLPVLAVNIRNEAKLTFWVFRGVAGQDDIRSVPH